MMGGKQIDLNADVGEGFSTDAALMPFISSANIACGFHAGNRYIMAHTVELCMKYGIAIGAHPSFADRKNFGREAMHLTPSELSNLLLEQLFLINDVCKEAGATLHHVKPHGALYNLSAQDTVTARIIAETVYGFNPALILYGLSGSHSVSEGVMAGLKTAAEVFADRTYQPDGSLTPRSNQNALIADHTKALHQAMMLATQHQVEAVNGDCIFMDAETICIHGDGPHAVSFAQNINQTFIKSGIRIKALE